MATADDRIDYARVERILDYDPARVWAIAGTFGGIERWVDGVASCAVEGEGIGAVRHVSRGGNAVRERLDHRDEARRELRYTILDPSPMPARGVVSTLTLEEVAPGRTQIVWASSAARIDVPPEALGSRIEIFYAASIDALDRLLADG